ncbi:hypothetical protein HMSSN139_38630 [Paenibacillus sp. HMSSN-139]|nr:hypothetical protein HMSSN139_38630 [Paenibacillus sp. HMSSN-139]
MAEVEVRVGDTTITCTGLIDTGNQLTDPLSRLPVTVMEASLWERVLPPSYRGKLADERADNLILELTEAGDFPWPERLRLVPYRGINKGTQFMLALKPDEVTVRLEGREYRSPRVLIGLDGGRLSTEGTYRAIVHPALVETAEATEGTDHISKTGT